MPVRYRHWYIKRLSKHFEERRSNTSVTGNQENFAPLSRVEEIINKKLG
jgi:hypothetical protein